MSNKAIIDEVITNRGLQQELAAHAPQDPRRAFGEAVEAGQGAAFQQVLEVLGKVTEKLITKIDEHFVAMERRVRPVPYAPVAGNTKALTIPQYLNEREREVPGFAAIRKRFTPCFNTVVSMMKHQALRSSGRSYGGQRAFYTERDRPVLNEAWQLSSAYREAMTAGESGPTVLEMLRAS